LSTVRFRSKSCLFFDPDGQNQQRGLVVAIDAAKIPAGECGVENQVGRVGVSLLPLLIHLQSQIHQNLLDH
jgi:hypothetical protein